VYHQTIPPKEGPKNDEKMSNGSTWAPPPPIPSLRVSYVTGRYKLWEHQKGNKIIL
jgi:hypothetical protein